MSLPVMHHVVVDGEQRGPFSFAQLQGMWRSGSVNRETLHFMDGYDEWLPLAVIEEDLEPKPSLAPATPAGAYPAFPPAGYAPPKNRGIYIIIGILGGCLGLHNFYAGRSGYGLAQLLVTILTGWLIVPLIAVGLWVLIELCIVDRDGKGRKMG